MTLMLLTFMTGERAEYEPKPSLEMALVDSYHRLASDWGELALWQFIRTSLTLTAPMKFLFSQQSHLI